MKTKKTKKIKVIDLLNKIANKEEVPEKIKYNGKIYQYSYHYQWYLTDILREELFIDKNHLNDEIEIIEDTLKEDKKTIDDLNLSLQEIETFQEARQIFLKLNDEEDKQTFIKLLLGEGTYERWLDYLKSKEK